MGAIGGEGQGVADGLPSVGLAADAELRAQEGEAVGVLVLEVGEGFGIGGAGDDNGADAVALGEEFHGALEHGLAAQILIELGTQTAAFGVAARGAGGGEDDADSHAGG